MPGARMNSPLASFSRSTRAFALTVMSFSSVLLHGQLDVSQPDRRAGLGRHGEARPHRLAVDRRAVGRAEILDPQCVAHEAQSRMPARYRRVGNDQVALPHRAADHHALGELADRDLADMGLAERIHTLQPHHAARRVGGADVEDMDRAADVLETVVAAVDIGVVDAQLGDVAHRARDRDAARIGDALDAGGEVHAVAEDVLVLLVDDHLAEMHADAEQQALLFAEGGIEARHALLDVDRRIDRRDCRAELGQHCVARRPDQPPAAGLDRRPPDLVLRGLEMPEGARLRPLHQAREAREVGVDDGGEAALHGYSTGQISTSRARPARYFAVVGPTLPTGRMAGPAVSSATYDRPPCRMVASPGLAGISTPRIAWPGMVTTASLRKRVKLRSTAASATALLSQSPRFSASNAEAGKKSPPWRCLSSRVA